MLNCILFYIFNLAIHVLTHLTLGLILSLSQTHVGRRHCIVHHEIEHDASQQDA